MNKPSCIKYISLSLIWKAEATRRDQWGGGEAFLISFYLLRQLTKYFINKLFLVSSVTPTERLSSLSLQTPRLNITPKVDQLKRRRMLHSFLPYKVLGLSILQTYKFFNFTNDSTNNTFYDK